MSASTPRISSGSPIVVADSQFPLPSSSIAASINHNRQHHHHPNQIHANPGQPAPFRQETGHSDGDIDMAVDEDAKASSSPGRSTIAYCKSCGVEFGEFFNSWSKVTGSYYLPCLVGSYRCTGLRPKGKPKPASIESALVECFIQPLVCDHCDDTLGIVCTSAPESKKQYAERDFFKLPKIELKSDVTGQVVEAMVEGGQLEPSHYQEPSVTSGRAIMEPPLESSAAHARKYSAPPTQHRPESPEDVRRYESMASRPIASHPTHQAQKPMYHEREPAPQNRHSERGGSFASPVNGHMHTNGHPGSPRGGYPSNIAVKLEAIDRIQTQVNLNRATLETCTRDISRLEGNIVRLQASFAEHFEALRMEIVQSRQYPQPPPAQQGDRLDDEAFAVFSDALSNVQTKVNEVDHLRLSMEMIKRKIKRLEEGQANTPSTDRAPYSSGARESSIHHTPVAQAALTPNVPHMTPPSRLEARPHGNYRGHLPSQTPDVAHSSHAADAESASRGWVSVNLGAKRGLSNGVDGRSDAEETPIGSPKRPKLAPLEPRHTYEAAPEPGPIRFERMDTDESTPSQSQSQRPAAEIQNSYPDSTNPSTFIPYTNQMNPEDSWRPESQRAGTVGPVLSKLHTQSSPRGRPRGRGRGGRPRKSLPADREVPTLGTPEWEKETWTGAQVGTDGYYYANADRGALIRRGSGGGQGQPIQATSPQSSMGDPYGHGKKTRTKPIRNSDGVLIRKDGRPDMRSQSSAANLRKVHARKEEEKRMEPGSEMSPTLLLGTGMTSPDSQNSGENAIPSSTQERTNFALQRMFPHGVEEHRGILSSSEHHFPSTGRSPMESKAVVSQPQSEGSGESEAPTREPSHFNDQPVQEHRPEVERFEHHVESRVEADVDEKMDDRPVEQEREDSTQHGLILQSEKVVPLPAPIPATNDTLQSTRTLQTTQTTNTLNSTSTLQSTSTVQSDNTLQASSATHQSERAVPASVVSAGVTA